VVIFKSGLKQLFLFISLKGRGPIKPVNSTFFLHFATFEVATRIKSAFLSFARKTALYLLF